MTHLAITFGDWPRLTWQATFLAVLLPAMVVGAVIGLDRQRRADGRRGVPFAAWSPLLLVVAPALAADDFIGTLLATGEGSGAIGVVLIGMLGGSTLAARGHTWVRVITGVAAVGITGLMVVAFYVSPGATASSMFGAVHLVVLMAWLSFGCSLALRRDGPGRRRVSDGRPATRARPTVAAPVGARGQTND